MAVWTVSRSAKLAFILACTWTLLSPSRAARPSLHDLIRPAQRVRIGLSDRDSLKPRWRAQTHRLDRDYCQNRLYVAPRSGRTFMASVLGLADAAVAYGPDSRRLTDFLDAWARVWPGLHIEHQPTFLNHPDLRGYGLAAGTYLALTQSLKYMRFHNATCDYHLMFEDDAVPFTGTTWPGGTAGVLLDNDLDARLNDFEAEKGTVLILGGHRFKNISRAVAANVASLPHGGIMSIGMADGSYGYVIPCSALAHVAEHIHAHLRKLKGKLYFEQALWGAFKTHAADGMDTGVFVSVPLLVDHATGFSATWNRTVSRAFEGNATFW